MFLGVVMCLSTNLSPQFVRNIIHKNYLRNHTRQKCHLNEGVVSKETVVLRRWGSSIQKFGFINGVDNVNWPPYRDSKS